MSDELMMENTSKSDFDPHPEGPCMAVCRDIYVDVVDNPKAGQTNQWGNVEPPRLTYIYFEFLTDEPIEINGKILPRFVRHRVTKSWGEKSNCRKFVGSWDPAAGKNDTMSLSAFVGRGAYLNIVHNVSGGKTYANIATIAAPPKGATIPMIPKDFIRHKDKAAGMTSPSPQHIQGEGEENMPF